MQRNKVLGVARLSDIDTYAVYLCTRVLTIVLTRTKFNLEVQDCELAGEGHIHATLVAGRGYGLSNLEQLLANVSTLGVNLNLRGTQITCNRISFEDVTCGCVVGRVSVPGEITCGRLVCKYTSERCALCALARLRSEANVCLGCSTSQIDTNLIASVPNDLRCCTCRCTNLANVCASILVARSVDKYLVDLLFDLSSFGVKVFAPYCHQAAEYNHHIV